MNARKNPDELKLTRLYDAPVSLVWDAWTDPAKAAKWWGPRGFTITTHSKDLRPGGSWIYTMHGPDGTNYPNKTIYYEVEKNSKLVYDHGGNDEQPPLFRVTVLFNEINGKTKMDMTMSFSSPESLAFAKNIIKLANGNSTWDRLAEYLEANSTGKEKFVINRSFDVPVSTLFEMWTKPEHVAKWLAPTGFTMNYSEPVIKVGSRAFYSMGNDQGVKMYGSILYLEIKPGLIKYTQDFRDEAGKISRHPFAPIWPETMLTTVVFSEEGSQQSRITITWEPIDKVTTQELEEFIKARGGMTVGWTGSLDKLESYMTA